MPAAPARLVLTLLFCCAIAASAHAQRGADKINVNGQLVLAARAGLVDRVQSLLAEGAQVNSRDRNGDSPLNMAAQKGNEALVDVLLAAHADVQLANLAGVTPLMAAAHAGKPQIVRKLLASGARDDSLDRVKKNAAVYAAGQGCTGCLEELLKAGTPLNVRLSNNLTLLMWTAGYGHIETARWLLGHGADPALRDDRGKTAADIAREQNYLELAQLLKP
jgi:ankyrin repeat protein